jgi:hypothetical protein
VEVAAYWHSYRTRRLALILFYSPINTFIMSTNSDTKSKAIRSVHLDVRFSPEEKAQITQTAQRCGLNLSNYVRKRALGYQPKARLTDKEAEALVSLCNVRGDMVHFKNALTGLSKQERAQRLFNPRFLAGWMEAIEKIILRWNQIIKILQS